MTYGIFLPSRIIRSSNSRLTRRRLISARFSSDRYLPPQRRFLRCSNRRCIFLNVAPHPVQYAARGLSADMVNLLFRQTKSPANRGERLTGLRKLDWASLALGRECLRDVWVVILTRFHPIDSALAPTLVCNIPVIVNDAAPFNGGPLVEDYDAAPFWIV